MNYEGWHNNQIEGINQIFLDSFGYKTKGYFVEVGAYDCQQWSPTFPLAKLGWSGIYIEPQSDMCSKCRETHANNPKIKILNLAISDYVGIATLHLGGSLSTIDEAQRAIYLNSPEFRVTGLLDNLEAEVQVSTLNLELERHSAPLNFDLLVIDVEGSELSVLRGFNIRRWQPTLVIIEAHEHYDGELSYKAESINAYMSEAKYLKIYSDHINNIYRRL